MDQPVKINLHIPEQILHALRMDAVEFALIMKELTALKLYESNKLSIGQAAALADMDELDFIKFLGKNKVSIFGSAADISEDFSNE